ncbi:UDP-2,3-diacylglucosamine pyrophosphatase [Wigglesworthia glossinidia endosymbiont of Glossina morsitans morsitans (Yale colony)]|uniref:UDP-2,3-diacylglucosamine hydrolase n=1 Tax=Wigglesworthia glossinidia endosymbiont of Glossina morsitans morsitans (Yale colony) TaxID=1142511 RepID=H6Q573_WIGGL|nr:UDP-2,3-diacylglucosamine diphosphatase [Wigglesworthia glossinidia]AFA41356.1 UDP-2,3-diacylglucosamine pyrophosphatase [Wigglesworthia glossinidia endosymbiont of Glossina morsitans morsitans (Yale colony)]
MKILFISDVHLNQNNPNIINLFLNFLKYQASSANALYILGDLFDIWIGDDYIDDISLKISQVLKNLVIKGTSCYFIHGNRDFLIGKKYAKLANISILPNGTIINLNGKSTIILHGDTLCTYDQKYQKFRKIINKNWLKKFFLNLPLSWRIKISTFVRNKSIINNKNKKSKIMDVNDTYALNLMQKKNASIMIHGHTHLPRIHRLPKNHYRIVLGMWDKAGYVLEIKNKLSLIKFSKYFNSTISYTLEKI